MGVYVKGMYMPPSCYFCPMTNDGLYLCKANNPYQQLEDDCEERRPDWCPLVTVPEHGRLGDLDELHKEAVKRSEKAGTHDIWYNCADRVICALDIKNAPTIIPADPKEEEMK